jgi:hypothetical protein
MKIRGGKKLIKYKYNLCNKIIFFQTRLKYLIYLKNYNKGENIEKKKLKFPFNNIYFIHKMFERYNNYSFHKNYFQLIYP